MNTVNILSFLLSCLFGSWCVMIYRYVQARREIGRLEKKASFCAVCRGNPNNLAALQQAGWYAEVAGKALKTLGQVPRNEQGISYQDKDGDGVPDVFQRRKPLSKILEFEEKPLGEPICPGIITHDLVPNNGYLVEIDLPTRAPKIGEYFVCGNMIVKAGHNYSQGCDFVIVKSVPGTNLDDLVEISK